MTTAPLSVISLGALPTADSTGMIILQDDYTETLVVPQGMDITIDLNGHTINLPFGAEETELIRLYGNRQRRRRIVSDVLPQRNARVQRP